MSDGRADARHRISIRGKLIIVANVSQALDCLITDLSLNGARIELQEAYPLPSKVLLFEESRQNIFECQVRWMKENVVGLSFVDLCSKSQRRALIEDCSLGLLDRGPAAKAKNVMADATTIENAAADPEIDVTAEKNSP